MSRFFLSFTLLLLATTACKEGPIEPAPLEGGETLTYSLDGRIQPPLTIEKTDDGFIISGPATGLPPQKVAANLRNGRDQIPFFEIGVLWLEPSQRKLGGQTHLGNVVLEEAYAQRPALKLQERNGRIDRWYCPQTGFLLGRRQNPGGPPLSLVSSTIPGL